MANSNGQDAVKAMLEMKKGVIVIIGAGVSIAAGIPSFRGIGRVERHHESRPLVDIMSCKIRTEEPLRKQHCHLIADMAARSINGKPTKFHGMLRALNNANKLIRVYTQNIDGLESKVGFDLFDRSPLSRCITLHGSLANLRCDRCSAITPLEGHFGLLQNGALPPCLHTARARENLRPKIGGCGTFYPDIALYGENVKDEEYITEVVKKDASNVSAGVMLLVVGTSLQIPGVRDMIRTLGKHVVSKGGHTVLIDIEPNVPETLQGVFSSIIKMDCQEFAQSVVDGLAAIGVSELEADADLRRDMRPLWDWNSL